MAENAFGLTRAPRLEVPSAETPKQPEALFGLATGVVVVSALYLARDVLIPITLAVCLTFFLAPIVKPLQRARLPKVAAVAVSVVLALAVILLVGGIIGYQLKSLVVDAPQYQSTVINKYETLHSTINGLAKQIAGRLGPAFKAPERAPGAAVDAEPDQPPLPVVVQNSSSGYLETAKLILEPILSPLSTPSDRSHRANLRSRSAGGSSGSAYPAVWLQRSSSDHPRDGRRHRTPDPVFPHSGCNQRKLRGINWFWSISYRLAEPNPLGTSRGATAIPSLCGCDNRRRTSCGAGRRCRSRLVHGALDSRAFHRRRGRNRPNPGAGALWQQCRLVSDGSGYRRHFLELDLGTGSVLSCRRL